MGYRECVREYNVTKNVYNRAQSTLQSFARERLPSPENMKHRKCIYKGREEGNKEEEKKKPCHCNNDGSR